MRLDFKSLASYLDLLLIYDRKLYEYSFNVSTKCTNLGIIYTKS